MEDPERSGGLRPAAAGLEGSAAHPAPPERPIEDRIARERDGFGSPLLSGRCARDRSPQGPRPRSGLGSREPGARVYPRGRQALLQEVEITALHEPTPAAHGPTHLIAEMVSRIAPVGFDSDRFKESTGDFALGHSGERAVKRLKHKAPPTGPRIGRVKRIPEIAIRDEIGQSAQEKKPTLEQLGRHNHVSE